MVGKPFWIDLDGLFMLETSVLVMFCQLSTMMFLFLENIISKNVFLNWFQTIPISQNAQNEYMIISWFW